MKPPAFLYAAPPAVAEALTLLAQHGPDAKVLAGGQSLMPLLNFRLARPGVLIDLNRILALDYITSADGEVRVGAMTRQRTAERSPIIATRLPLLTQALRWVGHPQIRNRGTVGGSLAHADPSAELPAVAAALEASFVVSSARGERVIPCDKFFTGYLTTRLAPDELLTEIRFPVQPPGSGSAFVEISRRHGDFALVGAAAVIHANNDGRVDDVRLAFTGVGPGPVRIPEAEDLIRGRDIGGDGQLDGALLAEVGRLVSERLDPESDIHASAAYRKHVAGVLAGRALQEATARAVAGVSTGAVPGSSPKASPALVHEVRSAAQAEQPAERSRADKRGPGVMVSAKAVEQRTVAFTVNGKAVQLTVPVRRTLADTLRDDLGLTGTHLGCEHGVCGACTILMDGQAVRSCLLLAPQADGHALQTVEGLADGDRLNPLQEAFWEAHGLQCGFCTPGFLMTITEFLRDNPDPSEGEIREAIAGNLCRCTGYVNIIKAVQIAATRMKQ